MNTILALFLLSATDSLLNISSLTKNQKIEIEINSSGCFHHVISKMVIVGGNTKYLTYSMSLPGAVQGNIEPDPVEIIYDGNLSQEIENQIKLTLDYFREVNGASDGCTSIDSLTVKHKIDDKIISIETLEDAGCVSSALQSYFENNPRKEVKNEIKRIFKNPKKYKKMKNIYLLLSNIK